MEWKTTWTDALTSYVAAFDQLIGDRRTRKTFGETVRGIIGAGSLICQQIAGQSPVLSQGTKGAQRVSRLAMGASTQRSELDDRHLTARLREVAVEQLEPCSFGLIVSFSVRHDIQLTLITIQAALNSSHYL